MVGEGIYVGAPTGRRTCRGQSCEDERMLWEFIDQPFTEGWMGVC